MRVHELDACVGRNALETCRTSRGQARKQVVSILCQTPPDGFKVLFHLLATLDAYEHRAYLGMV